MFLIKWSVKSDDRDVTLKEYTCFAYPTFFLVSIRIIFLCFRNQLMVAGVHGVPGVHVLGPVVAGLSFRIANAQILCHRMEDPTVLDRE